MSRALKGIPKLCWSTSLRKFSIRSVISLDVLFLIISSLVADYTTSCLCMHVVCQYHGSLAHFNLVTQRLSDLSGLSNKSKLLVSQSSESGKTLVLIWVLNLFENQKLSPEKHANTYKLAYNFRNSSKDLRLRTPVRGLSLWFQPWEHIKEKTFLFYHASFCVPDSDQRTKLS